jgi:hypothetical protein
MFQISLQVLFVDQQLTLKSMNLDITGVPTQKMTLSALDGNSYDMCYRTSYIQKAAFIQKLLKGIVETAIKSAEGQGPISKIFDQQVKALSFKQLYTNHEYLGWLQK